MKVITGTVLNGRIEVPSGLVDGTTVAILAPDAEGFRLTSDQEDELAAALSEIEGGEYEDGDQLLAELRGKRPA
jgi:hypothetical protein